MSEVGLGQVRHARGDDHDNQRGLSESAATKTSWEAQTSKGVASKSAVQETDAC